jgi:hypothetical protein
MAACEQTQDMNMLEHGQHVHDSYVLLWSGLAASEFEQDEPALQAWFKRIRETRPATLLAPEDLRAYHVYHDCGKHLVLRTDDSGRRHFQDHAMASAMQYNAIFPSDLRTRDLIAHDMDFHTMRGDDLRVIWTQPFAATLYLTAWAEIRANATMFGGFQSESYKIKRSRLLQAAKKCSLLVHPVLA